MEIFVWVTIINSVVILLLCAEAFSLRAKLHAVYWITQLLHMAVTAEHTDTLEFEVEDSE